MNHSSPYRPLAFAFALAALWPATSFGQALIVNEYNGVTDTKYFDLVFDELYKGRDYGLFADATAGVGTYIPTTANADDGGSDPRWDLIPTEVDMQGRILGNGGNWIELVITQDNLDLRGWSMDWSNADAAPDNAGTVTFSSDSRWSNLRSGTILTIIETPDDLVPSVPVTLPDGTAGTPINVASDFSAVPDVGDFTVNAWLGDASLFTTGDWKVDNDDWQVTLKDDQGDVVQGPIGEAVLNFGGLNSREVVRLEADPIPGVNPVSGYDDGDYSTFGAPNRYNDNASVQNFDALRGWWLNRTPGDADLDGDVDNADVGAVFGAFDGGTGTGKVWADGSFDGDGDVDNTDVGAVFGNFAPTASATSVLAASVSASALSPTNADLIYDQVTGEITLDGAEAAGGVITNFVLTSDGEFINTDGLTNPFLGAFFTANANEISASDPLTTGLALIELGAVLQAGLTESELADVFGAATYVGNLGTGVQTLDLVLVPEPTTLVLMGLGGLAAMRRRRG